MKKIDINFKGKQYFRIMKIKFAGLGFLVALIMGLISACDSDDIKRENLYTFTGETVGEYLENRPELYSEFTKMLDTTKVMGLLRAYGDYTCFAPDNEAMAEFYQLRGKSSLEEFPLDTIQKIVYDHIIKDFTVLSEDFVEGRLAYLSMSERFISITFSSFQAGERVIKVNKTSPILQGDIEVHNGVIHTIGEVLKPTELTITEAIASDPKFKLFNEALVATGLDQEMLLIEDETYDPDDVTFDLIVGNGNLEQIPQSKKYGYTALMVSDSTFAEKYGITSLSDLEAKAAEIYDEVYPEDANVSDITDRKNSLNRFIAYHLINKQLGYTKFILDYDTEHMIKGAQDYYDMYEYIEPMCPKTLMEVKIDRSTSEINIFNQINATGEAVRIIEDNYDNDAINGVYHEIDGILAFSLPFYEELASKRLRMDGATFFPEFTNNNMRGSGVIQRWVLPLNFMERLTTSETTKFTYLNADARYEDFQGDEIFIQRGVFDIEMVTPPIPAGTYEVRFSYQPTAFRGVTQLYFNGMPAGIPLDLAITANDPLIGHETPGTDPEDPFGYENDKMMRNRGYMKGPASYQVVDHIWYPAANARISSQSLRRILGIYTFEEMDHHVFKARAVEDGEFMFDYLEFVPTEVLEYEDIY